MPSSTVKYITELPKSELPDYACQVGGVKRGLDKVGVKNVEVYRRDFTEHRALTSQSAYVSLGNANGAHMSRLISAMIDREDEVIDIDSDLLDEIVDSHEAQSVYWECKWRTKYEGESEFMFDVSLEGIKINDDEKWYLTFVVPYASVCPCAHQMVKSQNYGIPHMQRSKVTVTGLVKHGELNWILSHGVSRTINAVQLVPESLMKRPDELLWCQRASDVNLFVEDAARKVGDEVDSLFDDWVVQAEHEESIHTHNVIAVCKKGDLLM